MTIRPRATRPLWILFWGTFLVGCNGFEKEVDGDPGKFKITGEAIENVDDFTKNKVNIMFKLENPCGCTEMTFIQAVRITRADGTRIQPNSEQTDRQEPDGWSIDRVSGATQPWYPLNDDGTYNPTWDTPGSDTVEAVLKDEPGASSGLWPILFEFVTCAVCKDGRECRNRNLKCMYWTFRIAANGDIEDEDARKASAEEVENFDDAVDEWNADAPGLAKTPIPPLTGP